MNIGRIGFVFTGISHDNCKHLSGWGQKFKRSFVFTYENHFEKLIDPLKHHNSVEIFITTYNSELKNYLIEVYQPKSSLIINGYGHKMRSTYIKSIENLINYVDEIDFFICTRFDIKFYNEITDWNLDYSKFNFLFKETWGSESKIEVCDVFFAFPKTYLQNFLNAIKKADINPRRDQCSGDLHHIYDFVAEEIGTQNMHFISEKNQSTANAVGEEQISNSFFYLCRN